MNLLMRLSLLFFSFVQYVYLCLISLIYPQEPAKCVPPSDEPILKLSATALAQKVRERKLYSQEIIQAYKRRIQEVNPIINAVVEERFEEALEEAKKADRYLDENPNKIEEIKITKPLFGIPITIKESIAVKGMSYTGASLTRKNVKADKDSMVVQRLREAGLIPLLISNTPEYCSSIETCNKITGYTYNPYNTLHTAGGSSGGEGALLGSAASLIGVGSDICGSIRVPAIFNGIFGHKTSKKIVSLDGHWPMVDDGLFQNYLIIGPMARYAEDLKPLLKIMSGANAQTLNLDDEVDLSKIQIYYMEDTGNDFGLPTVQKEIKTAVKVATAYLSRECHCHVSNRKFKELSESIEIAGVNLMDIDPFPSPLNDTNEKYNVVIETIKALFGKSKFTSQLLTFSLLSAISKGIPSYKQGYRQKLQKLREVLLDALGDNGVLIYPCIQTSAFKLNSFLNSFPTAAYLALPNLLGLPATAVPTGFDTKKLPVGIQIIAGPNQDRLTLAVAQELEKCFGGWQPIP